MKRFLIAAFVANCVVGLSSPTAATATEIRFGDVFVASPDFRTYVITGDLVSMQPALWKVNPLTGAREIITSKSLGAGPELRSVTDVIVDRQKRITIADPYAGSIFRVDPATGDRTALYDPSSPASDGPLLNSIGRLALGNDSSIYVGDFLSEQIVRIDPGTALRTLISSPGRGTGPELKISDLVVASSGDLWATVYRTSESGYGLVHIDPATGDRTLVSGFGVGDGPQVLMDARGLTLLDDHTAAVLVGATLTHIDLLTGNRTTYGKFIQPPIDGPFGIGGGPSSGTYIVGEHTDSLYRLDLATLQATLISGPGAPTGQNMLQPQDVFVFVPEPSATMLAAGVAACLVAVGFRRAYPPLR